MQPLLHSGKIRAVLLLGLGTITMVNPSSAATSSQTASGQPAPPFTAIDLNPNEFTNSRAWGVSGGQQVGEGHDQATGKRHALLWRGSAASVVDLYPSGRESEAHSICGGQQVGSGTGPFTGGRWHALLWRGSAASAVDLHPRGFDVSEALGTSGEQQVGYGHTINDDVDHALLWHGSAASVVDLHSGGFFFSYALSISGRQQVGWRAVDIGIGMPVWVPHALLWSGTAGSMVDLQGAGDGSSQAVATNGREQVGVRGGHALMWRGSAASVVDLHAFLPPGFATSNATGIDSNGDIVGYASLTGGPDDSHAFLWKRNMPRPVAKEQDTMRC